ncbi:hypothetical protein M8818_003159 [Zalaria obscura]|uniref:Uncharacterized protein n=1 Tax=Zalaria obscura TaxID=2024903 RepID=A0ACC3SF77_9PEZI
MNIVDGASIEEDWKERHIALSMFPCASRKEEEAAPGSPHPRQRRKAASNNGYPRQLSNLACEGRSSGMSEIAGTPIPAMAGRSNYRCNLYSLNSKPLSYFSSAWLPYSGKAAATWNPAPAWASNKRHHKTGTRSSACSREKPIRWTQNSASFLLLRRKPGPSCRGSSSIIDRPPWLPSLYSSSVGVTILSPHRALPAWS